MSRGKFICYNCFWLNWWNENLPIYKECAYWVHISNSNCESEWLSLPCWHNCKQLLCLRILVVDPCWYLALLGRYKIINSRTILIFIFKEVRDCFNQKWVQVSYIVGQIICLRRISKCFGCNLDLSSWVIKGHSKWSSEKLCGFWFNP